MDQKIGKLDYFYLLAPAWLALELTLWPGFRAGVFSSSAAGVAAFYAMEAAIGAAFYFRSKWAVPAALLENVVYLAAAVRFVVFTPLDIAASAETADLAAAGASYRAALPGILYSAFYCAFRLRRGLGSLLARSLKN
ncbi:MAG: hypothetical protein AB1734_01765 [Elusimicrobiota bacterium]|jgi:hypothetical protein